MAAAGIAAIYLCSCATAFCYATGSSVSDMWQSTQQQSLNAGVWLSALQRQVEMTVRRVVLVCLYILEVMPRSCLLLEVGVL